MQCRAMMLLSLLCMGAMCADVAPTSFDFTLSLPVTACDGFSCDSYSLQSDGRGSCPIILQLLVSFSTTGPVSSLAHFVEARAATSGYCSDVGMLVVVGTGATIVDAFSAVKRLGDAGELIGYDVSVDLVSTANPTLNITYECVGALQHLNVFMGDRVVAHLYQSTLTLLSLSHLVSPKVTVVAPGSSLQSSSFWTSPAAPHIKSQGNSTLLVFEALDVSHFTLSLGYSFESVYRKCSSASWWNALPESAIVRYGIIGGVIVGGVCLTAAIAWLVVKKCIKNKVNKRLYVNDIDVLQMDDIEESTGM